MLRKVLSDKHQKEVLLALGRKIKSIKLDKGIKQNEIAYRCHFDKSSYNNIEAGKRNITIVSLYKISKALDEPIENFIVILNDI